MDLSSQLIFLVIFGVVGFIISKFIGINPYRIFSDAGAILVIVPLCFFIIQAGVNPSQSNSIIQNIITFFVSNLPGIIIGDVAGSIIGVITNKF